MRIKPLDLNTAPKIVLSFYTTGFQDYLGARLLLNNGLLLQGAILACTAVEKYCKAFLAASNKKVYGHLSDWSYKKLSKFAKELGLNPDFFGLLQIVYRVRYLDNLTKAVSFSIERSKFLAELDHTIKLLAQSVKLRRGSELVNPYETARQAERPELVQNNYLFSAMDRAEFLAKPDQAEAFYLDASMETLSCVVTGWIPQEFGCFTKPGIIRHGSKYECTLLPKEQ